MDIADLVSTEYQTVAPDTRMAKVRSVFDRENPKAVVVMEDGTYKGIITEKQLVQSHVKKDAKAEGFVSSAPRLDEHEDLRDSCRSLVEAGTHLAPVFSGEAFRGVITHDAILRGVLDNLDAIDVDDIYTADVIKIGQDETIGKAISMFRTNGVSRLPVVDSEEQLVGIITTNDVIDLVVRDIDKQTQGERSGGLERMLDLPVTNPMSSPVATIDPSETVETGVRMMLDNNYDGLVVTDENSDDNGILGVLTKTDVLRALSIEEEHKIGVQITNIDLASSLTREQIQNRIEGIVNKDQSLQVQHAHVRFHEHKESVRGQQLLLCVIRLRTDDGQIAGTGEGFGANPAFRVAAEKLERNVIDNKRTREDSIRHGEILSKLEDL